MAGLAGIFEAEPDDDEVGTGSPEVEEQFLSAAYRALRDKDEASFRAAMLQAIKECVQKELRGEYEGA